LQINDIESLMLKIHDMNNTVWIKNILSNIDNVHLQRFILLKNVRLQQGIKKACIQDEILNSISK
jgi:hypothetical protein